ncbi:hypothetical protein [Microseira wollei]|uniref:Uncharacterized protein n=1 Tax=Microseira wollei NIES-4236 TaxID=2530354 RepID=A0AAV3XS43_9CYAN|nr:hypothetical protein [Microseira wollei]GET44668.1 hypothetical protein MiSe_95010 [Microseira wollei NIES-4236]
MGIYNPRLLNQGNFENFQTLEKLGEDGGRLTFNGAIVGGGLGELQLNSLTYDWSSVRGEFIKQDVLSFPLLATLVKISCNAPIRLRFYRSLRARQVDLTRPPYIAVKNNSGLLLDAILGGDSK